MIRLLAIIFSLSLSCISYGQQSLLTLVDNGLDYKKAIKLAQEIQKPIVAVLYSPGVPSTTTNSFQNIQQTIEDAGCIGISIDWIKAPRKKPQKNIKITSNPTWAFIHPNEVIIDISYLITDEASLNEFLEKCKTSYNKINASIEKVSESKKLSTQLEYANLIADTYDKKTAITLLDEIISGVNKKKISNNALKQIFSLGYKAPYSKNLNKLILKDYEKSKRLVGRDTILYIQERYILQGLNKKGLLEPYYVWERFENETGDGADSLYRIFALGYLSTPPIDEKVLYDEAFDYLQFYPNSEWTFLERLYSIVVPRTSNQEDLEILLDLISYQALREESYPQLDYKAVLLYKLGQKERALSMIQQINTKALEKGVRYKSMLYALSKK